MVSRNPRRNPRPIGKGLTARQIAILIQRMRPWFIQEEIEWAIKRNFRFDSPEVKEIFARRRFAVRQGMKYLRQTKGEAVREASNLRIQKNRINWGIYAPEDPDFYAIWVEVSP